MAFCISEGTLSDIEKLSFENMPVVFSVTSVTTLLMLEGDGLAGDVSPMYTNIC